MKESPDDVSSHGEENARKPDKGSELRRRIFEVITDHAAKELAKRNKKK